MSATKRMIGAQYRAERMHALDAAVDAVLVEIVSEQIDAVRTGQIVERISIEVGRRDPGRRLQKRADRQVPAYVATERKRDAISLGELQIRDQAGGLGRQLQCAGISLAVEIREPRKIGTPLRDDDVRRRVGLEDLRLIVLIERHQRRHEPRNARMPGERSVLCLRQLQPRLQADRRHRQTHGTPGVSGGGGDCRLHGCSPYSMMFSKI